MNKIDSGKDSLDPISKAIDTFEASTRTPIRAPYVAPENELEETLVAIWECVLGMNNISTHDDFFNLCGTSYQAVLVLSALKDNHILVSPKLFWENTTLKALAHIITEHQLDQNNQIPLQGDIPLMPNQAWFFETMEGDINHHHHRGAWWIPETVNENHLKQAIHAVVQYYDALRTCFKQAGSTWQQRCLSDVECYQHHHIIANDATDRQQQEDTVLHNAERATRLEAGGLFQFIYLTYQGLTESKLIFTWHRLVSDDTGRNDVYNAIKTAYLQLEQNQPIALLPKTMPIPQWVERLKHYANHEVASDEKEFWRSLSSRTVAPLRLSSTQSMASQHSKNTGIEISGEPLDQLQSYIPTVLPSKNNIDIYDTLFTALALTYRQFSDQPNDAIAIMFNGHGREHWMKGADLSQTVGWFEAPYPVYISLDENAAIPQQTRHVKTQIKRITHRGIGFAALREYSNDIELKNTLNALPRPMVRMRYHGDYDRVKPITSGDTWRYDYDLPIFDRGAGQNRPFFLEVDVHIRLQKLVVDINYAPENLSTASADAFAQHLRHALLDIIEQCDPR